VIGILPFQKKVPYVTVAQRSKRIKHGFARYGRLPAEFVTRKTLRIDRAVISELLCALAILIVVDCGFGGLPFLSRIET
jgi:hypothetical protein